MSQRRELRMADFPDKIPTSGKKSPVIPTSPAENAAGKAPDYKVGYGKPPKHSQYKEGESGNEKGRPRGSRNRLMELTDAMLEGSAEEIMQRVLELARNGDKAILVKCFEGLVRRLRQRAG